MDVSAEYIVQWEPVLCAWRGADARIVTAGVVTCGNVKGDERVPDFDALPILMCGLGFLIAGVKRGVDR